MSEKEIKPIWYFVGLLLLVVGGLVLAMGIYHLVKPQQPAKVLARLHPDLWWGIIMMIFGSLFFFPNIRRKPDPKKG